MVEKWTPERRRELTRTALLEAAADVFARRGFHGASLEEIAETAGFTRGAIYKNFDNKEEMFLAVIDRRIEAQLAAFSTAFEQGVDATDTDRVSEHWHRIMVSDPEWLALTLEFRLYALRNPEVRERWVAHQRGFKKALVGFIEQQLAAQGLTLSIPGEKLAGIVLPASQGFAEWAQLDPEEGDNFAAFSDLLIAAVVEQQPDEQNRARG